MNSLDYSGPERRNYVRVIYKPTQRATLKIAAHEFEVLDVNASGIRFANPADKTLATFVCGILVLLNGARVPEVGMSLNYMIPEEALEKEQRYIILNCDL